MQDQNLTLYFLKKYASFLSKWVLKKTIDVELDVGEQVRIQSGPFANQIGEVQEIEADKFKLTVLVDMFGRETPVEVEFDQIEKL